MATTVTDPIPAALGRPRAAQPGLLAVLSTASTGLGLVAYVASVPWVAHFFGARATDTEAEVGTWMIVLGSVLLALAAWLLWVCAPRRAVALAATAGIPLGLTAVAGAETASRAVLSAFLEPLPLLVPFLLFLVPLTVAFGLPRRAPSGQAGTPVPPDPRAATIPRDPVAR